MYSLRIQGSDARSRSLPPRVARIAPSALHARATASAHAQASALGMIGFAMRHIGGEQIDRAATAFARRLWRRAHARVERTDAVAAESSLALERGAAALAERELPVPECAASADRSERLRAGKRAVGVALARLAPAAVGGGFVDSDRSAGEGTAQHAGAFTLERNPS